MPSGMQRSTHLAHFSKILRPIGADPDQFETFAMMLPIESLSSGISFLQGAYQVAQ